MPAALAEVVSDFADMQGQDKLQLLLEFANELPPIPADLEEAAMEPVPECQSPLFLHVDATDRARVRLYFSAPPEAPTTRGFAAILSAGLDELSADARWTIEGPAITLDVSRLSFANADAAGSGSVRWRTADPAHSAARDRFPGRMTLDVRLTRADGARVARYLPVTVGASARQYLQTAIRAGRASRRQLPPRS